MPLGAGGPLCPRGLPSPLLLFWLTDLLCCPLGLSQPQPPHLKSREDAGPRTCLAAQWLGLLTVTPRVPQVQELKPHKPLGSAKKRRKCWHPLLSGDRSIKILSGHMQCVALWRPPPCVSVKLLALLCTHALLQQPLSLRSGSGANSQSRRDCSRGSGKSGLAVRVHVSLSATFPA